MGTISSGVGLLSGLDYQNIVNQLIAIDARPRDLVQQRIGRIDAQRTAYVDISARVSALLSNFTTLLKPSTFRAAKATSSNAELIGASAAFTAVPGSYDFVVRSLATTHQFVSSGFARRDEPLSIGPITLESAQARANNATRLEALNGFAGVPRGKFQITSRDGRAATINLNDAVTLNDVVDRVNAADIGVSASVERDRLVLRDTTGGTGTLRLADVGGGSVVAALGFNAANRSTTTAALTGEPLVRLSHTTPLAGLRDGLGLRTTDAGADFTLSTNAGDFSVDLSGLLKVDTRLERLNGGQGVDLGVVRITTRNSVETEVDLTGAQTIGEIQTRLQTVAGLTVTVGGSGLVLTDTTEATENSPGLIVADVSGAGARGLGILGAADETVAKITGKQVLQVSSLNDVLAAINYATGNEDGLIQAAIAADGQRLELTNQLGGPLTITAGTSRALADLGFAEGTFSTPTLTGRRITSGANTVLLDTLNGGQGVGAGAIDVTLGGQSISVDVGAAETLDEVLVALRSQAVSAGLDLNVGLDRTGTRIELLSGDGTTPLTVSGAAADALGLSGTGVSLKSGNLQRRYLNENTRIADLRNGQGISRGRMQLTNSLGASATLDLQADPPETLQDVIDGVAALGLNIRAAINDTGDGLVLIDEAGGANPLKVVDQSGAAGRDLNLLGEAAAVDGAPPQINGSFEYRIELDNGATLDDLVKKLNDTRLASASILNDGSPLTPYRLNIASRVSGLRGELLIDSAAGLSFDTLTQAQDARVLVGGDAGGGVLITSSTNSMENAIAGVTLDLERASDEPVTVTVERNLESVTTAFNDLVKGFNTAIGRLREVVTYDSETETRGTLFGESTPRNIEQRLLGFLNRPIPGQGGTLRRLRDVGVEFSGTEVTFNEEKFKEVFERDPDAVIEFFTNTEKGAAKYLNDETKKITDPDGVIDRRNDSLESRKELLQARVAALNVRLESKRARLLRQFQAMEQALAQLQGQQASLGSFSPISAGGAAGR